MGRPAKREAVTRAARAVFGRLGYVGTTIDAIAAEAGVSKRTVYNHFDGKEQLFTVLVAESATQVADRFVADVARTFAARDGERALTALGEAFAAQRTAFPEHFALVAQVRAQERHFPPDVIDAWQEAGPLRVQAEVARRLAELADRGLLRLADPPRAALHFSVLVTADLPWARHSRRPAAADVAGTVAAGVAAFLDGHRAA